MSEASFLHFCRRALQEQVAAIKATSEAAATAHSRLSALHAEMARVAACRPQHVRLLAEAA